MEDRIATPNADNIAGQCHLPDARMVFATGSTSQSVSAMQKRDRIRCRDSLSVDPGPQEQHRAKQCREQINEVTE